MFIDTRRKKCDEILSHSYPCMYLRTEGQNVKARVQRK